MSAQKKFTPEEFAARKQAKIDARDRMVAQNDPRYLQALRDLDKRELVFVPIFGDPNLGHDIYEVEK